MKTLLDAARKSFPDYHWEIHLGKVIHGDIITGQWKKLGEFDIEKDWPALQIALELEGYRFGYWDERNVFYADSIYLHLPKLTTADTKPELLLAIVRQGGERE